MSHPPHKAGTQERQPKTQECKGCKDLRQYPPEPVPLVFPKGTRAYVCVCMGGDDLSTVLVTQAPAGPTHAMLCCGEILPKTATCPIPAVQLHDTCTGPPGSLGAPGPLSGDRSPPATMVPWKGIPGRVLISLTCELLGLV